MLQSIGQEIIRNGYIICDHEGTEEDLLDERQLHNTRFLHVILNGDSYYLRMWDGRFVEIKVDYCFPVMMTGNKKYRQEIIAKIKKRYPDYKEEYYK